MEKFPCITCQNCEEIQMSVAGEGWDLVYCMCGSHCVCQMLDSTVGCGNYQGVMVMDLSPYIFSTIGRA